MKRLLALVPVCGALLWGTPVALAEEPSSWAQSVQAELAAVQAQLEDDRRVLADLDDPVARATQRLRRIGADRARLVERLRVRGGVSERAGTILAESLARFRRSRARLQSHALPDVYRRLATVQSTRVDAQDRVWELELPLDDPARLPAGVAEKRYREAVRPLLDALQNRVAVLEQTELGLSNLEALLVQQDRAYGEVITLVLTRSYWLRTDPVLGPTVLRRAFDEGRRLISSLRGAAWGTVTLSAFAILVVLVAATVLLARFLGGLQSRWNYPGSPFWQAAQRILVSVVFAAVAPALLLVVRAFVGTLDMPAAVQAPIDTALLLGAGMWFARRLVWRLFRDEGIAVREWAMPVDCAARLLRSGSLAVTAALFFFVPSEALREPPLHFLHLPRLLFLGYLVGVICALMLLVPRRGPVLTAWTGRVGALYRLWGVVAPLLYVVLVGVVGMHVYGYRLGARMLIGTVLKSVFAAMLITALYKLLSRVVDGLASRVRRRALEEDASRAVAREQSAAVTEQLTRVVSVTVVATAVIVLAGFWDVGQSVRGVLGSVHIVQTGADRFLSLWNLAVALTWIAAGHFIVRNLSGLYEFLVFPLVGTDDAGGRYVFMALARYALLLIAYSGAVLSLQFSYSNLGWLLAAASVGIGFGLQEIIANFVSGLILLLERPLRVGDIITVGQTGGVVEKITIRSTVVTNWDRQVIVVPNKKFITEEVTNWTRNDQVMRRKLLVGVRYGSDVEAVFRILRELVQAHEAIVADPAPKVWFEGFGESSLDFEVWFFSRIPDGRDVLNDLRTAIHARFQEAGIEIPFPQRDLHVRSLDDEALKMLAERRSRDAEPPPE